MEDVDSIVSTCTDVPIIEELESLLDCYQGNESCSDSLDYQRVECYKREAGIDLMDPFYSDNA